MTVRHGEDPAALSVGKKEPATILVASAAVIAAATPILRELIRSISGRDVVVRERRLLPVEDSKGKMVKERLSWRTISKG
jgi:hypothetical protein